MYPLWHTIWTVSIHRLNGLGNILQVFSKPVFLIYTLTIFSYSSCFSNFVKAFFILATIAFAIEPFWNSNFKVFMLSFESHSNMLMIPKLPLFFFLFFQIKKLMPGWPTAEPQPRWGISLEGWVTLDFYWEMFARVNFFHFGIEREPQVLNVWFSLK